MQQQIKTTTETSKKQAWLEGTPQSPSVNKTYSASSSHDAKLSYKKRNQFRSNYVGDSNPEMLESLAIWLTHRILQQKFQEPHC